MTGGAELALITLDAGALIALERRSSRMRAMLETVRQRDGLALIPAAVLAQVWRDGRRNTAIARTVKSRYVRVVALDAATARVAGVLLGVRRSSDVVDASVVVCARRHDTPVVTSDPDDLRHLDPTLRIVQL